jgi:uncharacterized RDD family membrane protein YckC
MSDTYSGMSDTVAQDRAVSILRGLEEMRTDEPMLAPPMDRLFARCIDVGIWIAVILLSGSVYSILALNVYGERQPDGSMGYPGEPIVWLSQLCALGALVTVFLLEVPFVARTGRSFSKRLVKIRVVDKAGNPPGLWRASLRWVLCFGPFLVTTALFSVSIGGMTWPWVFMLLTLPALAIPFWLLRDPDHRGMHDIAAGTQVVKSRG